jgi:hypothetical protein
MPLPTEETNWKVAFQPPSNITLVGSWANKLSVKPKDGEKYTVDLAVQMPNVSVLNSDIFHQLHTFTGTVPREGLSERQILPQAGLLPFRHRGTCQGPYTGGYILRLDEQ